MTWKDLPIRSVIGRIALGSVKGLGPVSMVKIAEAHDLLGEVVDGARRAKSDGVKGTVFSTRFVDALCDEDGLHHWVEQAAKDMEQVEREGGVVLSQDDGDYPYLLKGMGHSAPIVRIFGTLPDLEDPTVATVGTREPNRFGASICRTAVTFLVESGVTTVSGMARGVDKICHSRTMDLGGKTIAVIACGFSSLSRTERQYAEEIIQSGGTVVSQFRSDETVTASNLMCRNETIAGLSLGGICLQGSNETGGTRKAMSDIVGQEKPVFVPVPPAGYEDPAKDGLIEIVRAKMAEDRYRNLSYLLNSSQDFPSMLERIHEEALRRRGPLPEPEITAATSVPSPS
jgi:DNA processing protein